MSNRNRKRTNARNRQRQRSEVGQDAARDVRRDIRKVDRKVRDAAITRFPPNRTRVNGQTLELQKAVRRGKLHYHDGCSPEHDQLLNTILRPDDAPDVEHTIVPSFAYIQAAGTAWGTYGRQAMVTVPAGGEVLSFTQTVEVSTTATGDAMLIWPDVGSPYSDADWLHSNTSSFNPTSFASAGFQVHSLSRPGMPKNGVTLTTGMVAVDNPFAVCLGFTVRLMASKLLAQQMQGEVLVGHADTWNVGTGDNLVEIVRALNGTRSYMAETLVSDPVYVTRPSPFWHRAKTGATAVNPPLGYSACSGMGVNFFMLLGASQSAVEKYTFEVQHRYAYFGNSIPATVPFEMNQSGFECVLTCCALDSGTTLSYEEQPGRRTETAGIKKQISKNIEKSYFGDLPEWVVSLGQMALPALSTLISTL